jgi:hypothetical protein
MSQGWGTAHAGPATSTSAVATSTAKRNVPLLHTLDIWRVVFMRLLLSVGLVAAASTVSSVFTSCLGIVTKSVTREAGGEISLT